MRRTISAFRWSGLRRRGDPWLKAKTKTFYERKNQNRSASRRKLASRWSALSTDSRDPAFNRKENTRRAEPVSDGSFSGSLTIGNESPFQAHLVLETNSGFRLILRLENAEPAEPC